MMTERRQGNLVAKATIFLVLGAASLGSAATESDPPELVSMSMTPATGIIDVSASDQVLEIVVDASDESGVDWNNSSLSIRAEGNRLFYFDSDAESPGTFSLTFTSESTSGLWVFESLILRDVNGLQANFFNADMVGAGLEFGNVEVTGGVESDPPELVSMSMTPATGIIDVSASDQVLEIVVDASDESGVDWNNSSLSIRAEGNRLFYFDSDAESPGTFSLTFTSESTSGLWVFESLILRDVNGLQANFFNADMVGAGLEFGNVEVVEGFNFDLDRDGSSKALTDGLLLIRKLFGFSGTALTSGAVGELSKRDAPDQISNYLTFYSKQLDVDGDGESKALTDGLLLIRYLFGFSGNSLTDGAIGESAERVTSEEIQTYIAERISGE